MNNEAQRGSRATTIEELETILVSFFDQANVERGLAFQPHPTDIIISPYEKSGTTWLQQIAHGLRTRGSMAFDDIYAVIPWLEVAYDIGWDLDAPQVAEPRVFKSHLSWHDIPKGARYICSFRHYYNVIISLYRFFEGWMFEPRTISLPTFAAWCWPRDKADQQGYWYHLSSWWEQRHNKDILLLCYEDMKVDLPGTVRKVAHFMGITLDDELFDIVQRQSSREFMLAHREKFSERRVHEVCGKRVGLPPPIDVSKITPGTPDEARYQLSPSLKEKLDEIWQEQITARFGLQSYADLRQSLRTLHQTSE